MKLSVIVPIFNVEKYLSKCLDSLEQQSFKDMEVLLINDGSTDNSEKIAQDYVLKNSNFKYFEKKNGGLSDARNYGIRNSNGDFLAFVDSDDYVEKMMFEEMMKKQEETNADIVVCDMFYEFEDGTLKYTSSGEFELSNARVNLNLIDINNSACNKLFRKELFDKIEFPIGKWFEDLFIVPILLFKANLVAKVPKAMYYYVQRKGSIVHENNPKMFDIYYAIDNIKETLTPLIEDKIHFKEIIKSMLIKHGLYLTTLRIKNNGTFFNRIKFLKLNIQYLEQFYKNWKNDKTIKKYRFKTRIIFILLNLRLYFIVAFLLKRE